MEINLTNNLTVHLDVNNIIEEFPKDLHEILKDQLVGVYLTGSLTYGDFNRSSSDIDFLVVLRDSLTQTQREQIKDLHCGIAEKYPEWAKRIDCSYITQDMLKYTEPPTKPRPYVNCGFMWDPDPPYGNEWLLNLYVLYECGIALIGPDPKKIIGHPIDIQAVKEASKKDLYQEWEPLLKDSSPLQDSHFQSYVVLTLCRILHRDKHNGVASKKIASSWVKQTYRIPWNQLIEKAEMWKHGQEMGMVDETLSFIKFVIQRIEESEHD